MASMNAEWRNAIDTSYDNSRPPSPQKAAAYALALNLMKPISDSSDIQSRGALLEVDENSLRLIAIDKVCAKIIKFCSASAPNTLRKKENIFAKKHRPFFLSEEDLAKVTQALGFYSCDIYLPSGRQP